MQSLEARYAWVEQQGDHVLLGAFSVYKDAKSDAQVLRDQGYAGVEVVAFFNRTRLTLQEAMVLCNDQVAYEDEFSLGGLTISTEELNRLLFERSGGLTLDFKVHLGLYLEPAVLPIQNEQVSVELQETDMGFYTYVIGNFATKQEAIAFRKKLLDRGVAEAVVVPYVNGKRVSTDLAHSLGMLYDPNTARAA